MKICCETTDSVILSSSPPLRKAPLLIPFKPNCFVSLLCRSEYAWLQKEVFRSPNIQDAQNSLAFTWLIIYPVFGKHQKGSVLCSLSGWPHFWEAKILEFSLSFPRHFQIFPWATQEKKIRWNAVLLASMSHILHFREFPGFSTKIQISPSFPWGFDNFSNSLIFQVCRHPACVPVWDSGLEQRPSTM